MKLLLKTPLSPLSGYGNDGIGLAMALLRWGIDVRLFPTAVQPPLPHQVAKLFTLPVDGPFDLAIEHWDPERLIATPQMVEVATATLGWSMWEFTSLHNAKNVETFGERTAGFDALLAYDDVTADAFRPETRTPVHVLQGGFAAENWEPVVRPWNEGPFRFCMVGALNDRKAPFAAIHAFRALKMEHPEEFADAELHLKTNTPGLHSAMEEWCPKLKIHTAVWTTRQLTEFYARCHVLLAPSRGEGKNVPALEMLATGGTVIATDWGGHTGWLSSALGYPLRYTLEPQNPSHADCLWAEPDVEHLKELMLHVVRHRSEARAKGELAARTIGPSCSWDAVVRRLVLKLPSLLPDGRGARLKALADAAHREVEFEPRYERASG